MIGNQLRNEESKIYLEEISSQIQELSSKVQGTQLLDHSTGDEKDLATGHET